MKLRTLFTTTLQAGLVFAAHGAAEAANGRFGPDSDIIGLRLTMTKDEATAFVRQNFAGAPITALPVTIKLQTVQKNFVAGFIANLVSKEDTAANQNASQQAQADLDAKKAAGFGDSPLNMRVGQVGDTAQDRVKVLFDPNDGTTDIIGISRYTEYGPDKHPVTRTVVDALTEKYGPPTRTSGEKGKEMAFTWANPGVLERMHSSLTHCYKDDGFEVLYENAQEVGYSTDEDMVNSTGSGFVNKMNLFLGKNPFDDYAPCGTILQIRLQLSNNGDYVGAMSASLLNLSKAHAEIIQFGTGLTTQSDSARQQKINRDSANKPRL